MASSAPKPERLTSVDLVRGLIMAVMALDHVRDYFTNVGFRWVDPARTTPALFMTRWITHFCAPAFFLLAGVGVALSLSRGKSVPAAARFLLSRGAFLVLVDLTVVRFAWDFNFAYEGGPWLIVLTALGLSMIALAGLIFLPRPVIAGFAVVLIAGHNLCDPLDAKDLGLFTPLWTLLHVRSGGEILGVPFYVSYPLVPWVGVMALGYALGPVFQHDQQARRRTLFIVGAALTVGFVVLRAINGYGDPRPWTAEYEGFYNVLAFLRTKKYPPSLLYLLMTLGPILLALAWFDRPNDGPIARALITIGRVPLFFYVLHLYLIHTLAVAAGAALGYDAREFCVPYSRLPADYSGFSLLNAYLIWVVVLVALYPLCVWFADLKRRNRSVWLSYM